MYYFHWKNLLYVQCACTLSLTNCFDTMQRFFSFWLLLNCDIKLFYHFMLFNPYVPRFKIRKDKYIRIFDKLPLKENY